MEPINSDMTPTAVPAVVREHRTGLSLVNVGPPPSVSGEECGTVESLVGMVGGYAAYTSHWKPTPEQLELLNAGGSIELVQYARQMVMHSMSVWPADPDPVDPDEDLAQELAKEPDDDPDACPAGCGRKRPAAKVMCFPCWSEVPRQLQHDVYAAWRAVNRDLTGENLRRHREAKNEAHDGPDPVAVPAAGDVSICWKCGGLGIFTADGVRLPTVAELTELEADPEVKAARALIRESYTPSEASALRWWSA